MGPLAKRDALPIHIVASVWLPDPQNKHVKKAKQDEAPHALPENHDVAVSNFFGRTTPRFGILTGNTPDADLSP